MPVAYTNQKGITLYLCHTETKTGRLMYYFAREPKEDSPEQIPEGYEIVESVNGKVSLGKVREQLITDAELEVVLKAIARRKDAGEYRADIKGKRIIIYENTGPNLSGLVETLAEFSPLPKEEIAAKAGAFEQDMARFSPIMRFTLEDREKRTFSADYLRYFSEADDWMHTGSEGSLAHLAKELIPLLDTDELYDLF